MMAVVSVFLANAAAVAALSSGPAPMVSGHTFSGIPIRGAGVVPYANLPGRGVYFLLQNPINGSRTGKCASIGR